jgi:hypothetical protein
LERSENPGITALLVITAECVRKISELVQSLKRISEPYPGLSLRSNPGLKLANAFGVNENLLKEQELTNLLHGESQIWTPPKGGCFATSRRLRLFSLTRNV